MVSSMTILLLTTRPPLSKVALKLTLKSRRSISVFASKAAR